MILAIQVKLHKQFRAWGLNPNSTETNRKTKQNKKGKENKKKKRKKNNKQTNRLAIIPEDYDHNQN